MNRFMSGASPRAPTAFPSQILYDPGPLKVPSENVPGPAQPPLTARLHSSCSTVNS